MKTNRGQLNLYHKKITKYITYFYTICFFYKLLFQYFLFVPVINNIRQSNQCSEIYFSNEIGGYLWNPLDENYSVYQKSIFYFNDFSGNSTCRFHVIRKLQDLFPSYTMIQLDYPGFGISYSMPLCFAEIVKRISETIELILSSNDVTQYGVWTEGIGNIVAATTLQLCKNDLDPEFMIFHNPIENILQESINRYTILSSIFLIPAIWLPKSIPMLRKLQKVSKSLPIYIFICNEKYVTCAYNHYHLMDWIDFPHKHLLKIQGNGISSLLMKENENLLFSIKEEIL